MDDIYLKYDNLNFSNCRKNHLEYPKMKGEGGGIGPTPQKQNKKTGHQRHPNRFQIENESGDAGAH